MPEAPDIFYDNDITPDWYGGIYSPRVLGKNGNFVNFVNDTIAINDTWFLSPDWSGASSSPFYNHAYNLVDSFGYKNNGWIYSEHFGYIWFYNRYRDYNVNEDVAWTFFWLPESKIGNEDLYWCAAFRDNMSVNSFYNGLSTYYFDFMLVLLDVADSIGNVTVSAGSNILTGGTNLHQKVTVGFRIRVNGQTFIVDSVTTSTTLILSSSASANFTGTGYLISESSASSLNYMRYGITKNGSTIYFRNLWTGNQHAYSQGTVNSSYSIPLGDTPGGESQIVEAEAPPTPTSGPFDPDGFEESNIICCGYENYIQFSRRCTVINGKYFYAGITQETQLTGRYNSHFIGKRPYLSIHYDSRFQVGCSNGMYVTGDIVSDRFSDQRLKENIQKIKNATHKIKKIRAANFDWNKNQKIYNGHDIGLIAQDIEKVIPEAVSDRENGFKGVQYHKVIPLLVASIREKQNKINNLKKKIERLKNGKL